MNLSIKQHPLSNVLLATRPPATMKTILFATASLLLGTLLAGAQGNSYNPFLIQGTVSPAPLLPAEFGGTGVLSFDVGNTGSTDMPVVANQEMALIVSLSKGVPDNVDPLAALGGPGVAWFNWTYDPANKTYKAIQKATIPGGSRQTITIAYKVTVNSFLDSSPTVSNGFNVNLQPPPYTNPQPTDDDTVSSYTYVAARDYGDAPSTYGEAYHDINLSKDVDGFYQQYMYLGNRVDPENAYQASPDAKGDDNNQTGGLGANDEDGVTFPTLIAGATVQIPVTVTIVDNADTGVSGFLSAWIDWNGNGVFETTERISTNVYVAASGVQTISVTIPANAITTRPTFARFRFGPTLAISPTPYSAPYRSAAYGEVEDYQITILSPLGTITGSVLADTNNDNLGDTPLSGVALELRNATTNASIATTTTNGSGLYTFSNVVPGSYKIYETQPSGYVSVSDKDGGNLDIIGDVTPVAVTAGATNSGNNFVERQAGTITGSVLADTNNDNTGDSPLNNVTLELRDATTNALIGTTTTNGSGTYTFSNVAPGSYKIYETQPSGYLSVSDKDGGNLDIIGDVTPVAVIAGTTNSGNDFVERQSAAIGNLVWNDLNNNGLVDAGEPGFDGVTVQLWRDINNDGVFEPAGSDNQTPLTTVTAGGGIYGFGSLQPGKYFVVIPTPPAYHTLSSTHTTTVDNHVDNDDNGIQATVGGITVSPAIDLSPGETDNTIDFGFVDPGVGNLVWADLNNDGLVQLNEPGLPNVVVELYSPGGTKLMETTTDSNGYYLFTGQAPDSYVVRIPASNFLPGGALARYRSASTTVSTSDDGIDDKNHGSQPGGPGTVVSSPVVALTATGEPVDSGTETGRGHELDNGDDAGGNMTIDFGFTPNLSLGHRVFLDNGQGTGGVANDGICNGTEPGIAGVVVKLFAADGSGNPTGTALATQTTDSDGYYRFDNLTAGTYVAVVDKANSANLAGMVSSTGASTDNALTGALKDHGKDIPVSIDTVVNGIASTPVTLIAGLQTTGEATSGTGMGTHGPNGDAADNLTLDFGFYPPGTITGYVYAGTVPISGVKLTLLDQYGNPVDDPNNPGHALTTVTNSLGFYSFTGVAPGTYQVKQTQPLGYISFGDADGGNLNIVGDVNPIVVTPGQTVPNNNFLETNVCPSTWADWKTMHPGQTATGNPDGDAYDNFAEFAFAMPYDSGVGSPWLGSTAWIIRPSALNANILEGVFVRPKGAPQNVTYTLQYAASPGNPTVWQPTVITPEMITTADNGDCTETVTIHNLETVTGLTGGKGIVRVEADLYENPPSAIDHTSYTETEGWNETPLELCCQTYNNPFLRESVFTGTVSSVSGPNLVFATSAGSVDLATILTSGVPYYLEVTAGTNEGHRFDIVSASGNTVILANDDNLDSSAAPFNTLTGAPPTTLAGASVVIHRHWTLDEVFPPTGFGASGSQSTSDEVQLFAGGAWSVYWLYNGNSPTRWVNAADAGMSNKGATVIPPGQGMFFNDRTKASSILAYGEVRANAFIRPLGAGYNLPGGGYPVDQSATGTAGRAMTLGAGFFGSRDFKTADSFFIWNADATVGATGYTTYYLLNGAPDAPGMIRWIKVGDAAATTRDNETLLLGNRAVFLRAATALPAYGYPSPWTP